MVSTSMLDSSIMNSSIQSFYNGGHVLITGGTGFLGKALIEKLLRSCPDIVKIYLLIRCKKGKDEISRLNELLDDIVFSRLPTECPDYRKKVVMIPGDCSLPGLGIAQNDTEVIVNNVNIVIHGAATVKFDENLKIAAAINVNGTREIIQLCRKIPQLKALVHVSTAYSNCNRTYIEEKFYEPPSCSTRILDMAALLTPTEFEKLTPELLETWPNTYTLTKALAEHLVKHEEGHIPVCVFRPAIVTSVYKEPLPGWIDNVYGPTGMALGAGCGVVRVINADVSMEANMVPVDLTVNAILASAKETHEKFRGGDTEIKIYNFESVSDNPLKWGEYMTLLSEVGLDVPSERAIWYYSLTITKYWYVAWLLSIFLHFIPAILMDGVAIIIGKKPQMMRVYQKVAKFTTTLSYFATRRYTFSNNNVRHLIATSSDIDKELFNMDVKTINWRDYLEAYIRGAREYILKESWDTLPYARIKWRRLYWLHQMVKIAFIAVLCRIIYGMFLRQSFSNLPVAV